MLPVMPMAQISICDDYSRVRVRMTRAEEPIQPVCFKHTHSETHTHTHSDTHTVTHTNEKTEEKETCYCRQKAEDTPRFYSRLSSGSGVFTPGSSHLPSYIYVLRKQFNNQNHNVQSQS